MTTRVYLRWRAAFYTAGVDGCVVNFLNLLDDFLSWKMKAIQKEVEAGLRSRHLLLAVGCVLLVRQVHFFQSGLKEIDDEAVEKLKYENYTLHEDEAGEMPLKWYEAQPVFSKKIVVMHLQPRS